MTKNNLFITKTDRKLPSIHGLYTNKQQDQHVYTCLHLKLLTTSTVADHHPKIRLFSRNQAIEHDPGRSQYNQDQHIQHEG